MGNCRCNISFSSNGNILAVRFFYENHFCFRNQKFEKRIAITPEIAKKYIALGFEVSLSLKYGEHLGFGDNEYEAVGVKLSDNESEIIKSANVIVQLGLYPDDKISYLKDSQTLIGVFNPYDNKEKIDTLVKKILMFFP